ncbi:streptomycin 6-kinase [Tumebacillus sp. BK434]|uniref:aminoglycoside phosphotransferase family protein n=1 Tax=Tumebacillus sp. BK434 TaxID=2512169 RepID=UPI0010457B0A|nr:aminoglycoside phosphotransferase family protein [Tumebacillus sp. BK434]TCP52193.1 streptomycin 6-kinase [Tumebacillus sp. BK434]
MIPEHLERTICAVHGARGVQWLADLPDGLAAIERRFAVKLLAPYPNLTYNLVLSALAEGGEKIVVKLNVPNQELRTESQALQLHDGHGYVRLLGGDADLGVLLLEKVCPGIPLSQVQDDDTAVEIFCGVLQAQKRVDASRADFPALDDWGKGLERIPEGKMPAARVERARRIYRRLLETTQETTLLHGDLHHDNILSAGDGWVAIDPKGVIGDPHFELIPFLLNYLTGQAQLRTRIERICAKTGLDPGRVTAWGFAHMVLSAWWHVEDGTDGYEPALQTADYFEELLGGITRWD